MNIQVPYRGQRLRKKTDSMVRGDQLKVFFFFFVTGKWLSEFLEHMVQDKCQLKVIRIC